MLVIVAAAILILLVIRFGLPRPGAGSAQDGRPVTAGVQAALATVPAAAFTGVGAGPTTGNILASALAGGTTVWRDAGGRPVFLYVGAEWCPFCAATRWALVTALSRFGTFHGLRYMQSSSTDVYPDTPTFTFQDATYTSAYIDFQPVEEQGPVQGQPLMGLTTQQAAYRSKYETPAYIPGAEPGAYPFLDVANRYLWVGLLGDPHVLEGQTWATLARAVHTGQGPVAQEVLGGANRLTAALCAVDGERPGAVCDNGGVTVAAALLPKTAG